MLQTMIPRHVELLREFLKTLHRCFSDATSDQLVHLHIHEYMAPESVRIACREFRRITGCVIGCSKTSRFIGIKCADLLRLGTVSVMSVLNKCLRRRGYEPNIQPLPMTILRRFIMRDFSTRYLPALNHWINRRSERYCFPYVPSNQQGSTFTCDQRPVDPDDKTIVIQHNACIQYSSHVFYLDFTHFDVGDMQRSMNVVACVMIVTRAKIIAALERAFEQAMGVALGQRPWPFIHRLPTNCMVTGLPGQTYYRISSSQSSCCIIDHA